MHDEEPSAGTQDPLGVGELGGVDAPERRPEPDHDVRALVWPIHGCRTFGQVAAAARAGRSTRAHEDPLPLDDCEARPGVGQLVGPHSIVAVEQYHVAIRDRSERFEGAHDLAFDVEDAGEPVVEAPIERDREVGHRSASIVPCASLGQWHATESVVSSRSRRPG